MLVASEVDKSEAASSKEFLDAIVADSHRLLRARRLRSPPLGERRLGVIRAFGDRRWVVIPGLWISRFVHQSAARRCEGHNFPLPLGRSQWSADWMARFRRPS